MDDKRIQRYFIFILFFYTVFFHYQCTSTAAMPVADGDEKEEHYMQVEEKKTPMIIDTAKRLFSIPTTLPNPSNYWMRVLHYFSPPNLDFRGADKETAGEEGTTEKMKEAVVKSMGQSQETVHDSAKSAAKFAEAAVEKTVNKMKKTLSGDHEHEHEADL